MNTKEKPSDPRSNVGIRSPGPWRDVEQPNLDLSAPLVHRLTVGWGDCDPAQIAYTAKIPAWGLEAIEAWYRYCIGPGWYELNLQYGIGTPFVSLAFDFRSPVTPLHDLEVSVNVERLGNASLSHGVAAHQDGTLCFTGKTTAVFVEAETMKTLSIPSNIRASIERYMTLQEID